jgi:hypothetical protein
MIAVIISVVLLLAVFWDDDPLLCVFQLKMMKWVHGSTLLIVRASLKARPTIKRMPPARREENAGDICNAITIF